MSPTPPAPSAGSPATALVDLAAIRANVEALRAHASGAEVLAVVKADAYGHGLVPVARAVRKAGATWLGTAQLSEAIALRDNGVDGRILTWLQVPGADFAAALTRDIDVTVSASWSLAEVVAAAHATGRTARVHVKVDTGLGRGGVTPAALDGLLADALAAEADGAISVVGMWSHLACADESGHPSIRAQQRVFDEALARAAAAGIHPEVRHLANSAATLTDSALHYDLVRTGISVYGISPAAALGEPAAYGLVPAMTLVARLALVKDVPAGQGVSYGHHYTTPRATRLGLVPLGYADGLPRAASGVGPIWAAGRLRTVAGRVCMDQVVLDLGPDADAREGDEVVIFGTGAAGRPTAADWARATDTIAYEIVTRLGPRVERVYVGGEEA